MKPEHQPFKKIPSDYGEPLGLASHSILFPPEHLRRSELVVYVFAYLFACLGLNEPSGKSLRFPSIPLPSPGAEDGAHTHVADPILNQET